MPKHAPTPFPVKLEAKWRHLEAFLRRLKLRWLLHHFAPRPVWAAFVFANCFMAMALLAVLAMISRTPFIFPSLGPTAYVLFFTPLAPAASPKHAICGHLIGLVCGWGALWITGLLHAPGVIAEGVNPMRVLAAAISLGATGAAMILFHVGHPPAGATTLIVSLGFITQLWQLLVIEAAVAVLLLYAMAINRVSGIDFPLWTPKKHPAPLPRPPMV
jgi:CBS-domain-containing membrane protein